MLAGDSCHMRHLKGGGPVSPKPRQSPTFFANFRELRHGEVPEFPFYELRCIKDDHKGSLANALLLAFVDTHRHTRATP